MFHAKLIWGTVEEKIDGEEEEKKKKNLKQISSYQQAVKMFMSEKHFRIHVTGHSQTPMC